MEIYKCDNCGTIFDSLPSYRREAELDGNEYRVSLEVNLVQTKEQRDELQKRQEQMRSIPVRQIGLFQKTHLCPICLSRLLTVAGFPAK